MPVSKPFNTLSDWMKARFGAKVFKVTIDSGLTCPNRDGTKGYGGCTYCNSDTLVPRDFEGADIEDQLSAGIERVRRRHNANKFVAYFQINTNTHAPIEYLKRIYGKALHPDVVAIAVSTRPDCLGKEVIEVLNGIKKERHLWVELGLQSSNDSTLKAINRGHTVGEFKEAFFRARKNGIDVCAHMIIGLPGEGRAEVLDTVRFLSGLEVWGVKFHQLQVLKGTALEQMYRNGEVKTLSLDEYANLVVDSIESLNPDIVIHRLCGDAPRRFIVAPEWGVNKFIVNGAIEGLLRRKNTFQGAMRNRVP